MHTHLKIAQYIADLFDNRFKIFGFKFGIDPLLGLMPGFGDLITLVFSFYLVWIGVQMKLPQEKIGLMIQNIILDFVIGLVPVLGDFTDFVFKANTKNLDILKQHAPSAFVEGQIVPKNK